MTLSNIFDSSNTVLHLNGKDAYAREYGQFIRHSKKGCFESLLENRNSVVVVVGKNTAAKYARRINREGFILIGKADYSDCEYALLYRRA